jgi:sugar (pentulose or hexulose) kinase
MLENQQSRKYVLVIDLGTGGPKVGLVDQEGQVVSSTSAPVQVIFPPDDHHSLCEEGD